MGRRVVAPQRSPVAGRNDRRRAARRFRAYDPGCYLCPGNTRVSGETNPDYAGVFVFDNDHPCVSPAAPAELEPPRRHLPEPPADGIARVVCFTPRHDLTLAELPHERVRELLETLAASSIASSATGPRCATS